MRVPWMWNWPEVGIAFNSRMPERLFQVMGISGFGVSS